MTFLAQQASSSQKMHGLIHLSMKDCVIKNISEETWIAVCNKLGIEDDSTFLLGKQYDDSLTTAGIGESDSAKLDSQASLYNLVAS